MPLLGAHESVAGGLERAFSRILSVGGEALQIFTRNQRQWRAVPLASEEIDRFQAAWSEAGTMPVAAHASYLVNLAAVKDDVADKSVAAFRDELIRCQKLAIPWAVIHPGSHGGAGRENGLARVADRLDQVLEESGEQGATVTILLETTAGQGTGLGSRFEELAWIIDHVSLGDRLGVCVDTCHIFAAGYDIRTARGYQQTMEELETTVGLDRVHFFHLNDSRKALGSRVDRHEHIGKGAIGLEGFRCLLNDPRFAHHPMVLETPKSRDLHEDRENLRLLRSLIAS